MRVLCIGDIVSRIGRDMMFRYVDDIKYKEGIDFVIANGENAAHGNGLTRSTYDELIRSGADIVTLCLLVTSADGKVSLKERRYIKQLCTA